MTLDPYAPVVLAVLPTETEASLLVNFLNSQGITAVSSGAGSALGLAILVQRVDVQVAVRQGDIARAMELLAVFQEHPLDDDVAGSEEE